MSIRRPMPAALAGLLLSATAPANAVPVLHDQTRIQPAINAAITTLVFAADFNLAQSTRLQEAEVFLCDGTINDNNVLDGFSGTISWALYSDQAGSPGTFVASGTDRAPRVVDAGRDCLLGVNPADAARVRFRFDARAQLGPGTYWLAVHEGSWGQAGDLSDTHWMGVVAQVGASSFFAVDETNPGSWSSSGVDLAFTLSGTPPRWTQSPLADGGAENISASMAAANIFLPGGKVGAAEIWLADNVANDNGVLDSFSGTIGWGFYSDFLDQPGTLISSGTDSAPAQLDTGLQDAFGGDLVAVDFDLSGLSDLAADTYWLAVHEGGWLEVGDGSPVWWIQSSTLSAPQTVSNADETDPDPPSWTPTSGDNAFDVFDEILFLSGFEAGVACAWSAFSGGALCP